MYTVHSLKYIENINSKHAAREHWLAANIQYPTYSKSSCPHLNWHMFAHRCRLHIQHPPRIPRISLGHLSVAFRLQLQSQATISCRHHEGSGTTEIFFLQNAYNINKSMGVMSDAKKNVCLLYTYF